MIDALAADMDIPRACILHWIKMPEATAKRKIKNEELLDTAWSERLLALASLIGRAQHMVEESGDPRNCVLINPLHKDASQIAYAKLRRWNYDPRL